MSAPVAEPWVGQAIKRKEDPRLIMGRARYVDDINVTGQLWASFVRSPEAHAKIVSIDTSAAKARDGVVAVFTHEDLDMESPLPMAWVPPGVEVKTIEGMGQEGALHPLQEAFWEHHGLQCGYCTPGMIMAAADLLQRNSSPNEHQVREALAGNLCRSTGYHNIVKAVMSAAEQGVTA